MYYFAKVLITGLLIVYKKSFRTKKTAMEWKEQEDFLPDFELMCKKEIVGWGGEVIFIPLK